MASVDKIRIGSPLYDISPSGTGSLNPVASTANPDPFISSDASSPASYTASNPIATTDSQATIFTKLTTMVKNVRWLYSKLGTTDYASVTGNDTVSGSIAAMKDGLANSSHSHSTSALPISNQQVDSSSYIPTSSLVYSMNETLSGLGSSLNFGKNLTTNITCGGLASGTNLVSTDSVRDIVKTMLGYVAPLPPAPTEYESKIIGTWSSTSDVDTFFSTYTPQNGWNGLKLGNYVTINDGTYNTQWEIAGFNCEYNQTAADGTVYNNGGGLCMIPKTQLTTHNWDSTYTSATSYKDSDIHSFINSTVYNALVTKLGSHIIQRNVLLGSSNSGTSPRRWTTNNYTWTTSYLTLMSIGQMNGTFKANCNQYDDGEANYYLPLFGHESFATGSDFWSRCVWGDDGDVYRAWVVRSSGSIGDYGVGYTGGVRPLMYLR